MDDIKIICEIVKKIVEEEKLNETKNDLPIFSFEGLPGAGKTTQIKKVSEELERKYGKSFYIDLPTNSSIGLILKGIYSNKEIFEKIQNKAPWINPLLLSCDLKLALEKAKKEDSKYVLMARGILSTYYYNYKAYMNKYNDFSISWNKLSRVLEAFEKPIAIIFFELDPKEARQRVIKRNRGPLREMDQLEKMKEDRKLLDKYIRKIEKKIPIHYIDASLNRDKVRDEIDSVMFRYMELNYD